MGVGCWLCLFGTWRGDLRVDGDMGTCGSMDGWMNCSDDRVEVRALAAGHPYIISTGPPSLCDLASNHIPILACPFECFSEQEGQAKEEEEEEEKSRNPAITDV